MIICDICTGCHLTSACLTARRLLIQCEDHPLASPPPVITRQEQLERQFRLARQRTWGEILAADRERRRRATERKRRQRARMAA